MLPEAVLSTGVAHTKQASTDGAPSWNSGSAAFQTDAKIAFAALSRSAASRAAASSIVATAASNMGIAPLI